MANPQLIAGGPPVVVPLAQGNTGAGIGPSGNAFNISQNHVALIPDTSLATLPVTVNGLTVSAYTMTPDASTYASLTMQLARTTTLAGASGAIVGAGGAATAFGPVDIVTSPKPLVATGGQVREVTSADTVSVPGQLTVGGVLVGNINQVEITGASYALGDSDGILHFTGSAACTITLDATYPAKTVLRVKNAGSAALTVAAGAGMTIETGGSGSAVTLAAGSGSMVGGALTLIRSGTKWEIY